MTIYLQSLYHLRQQEPIQGIQGRILIECRNFYSADYNKGHVKECLEGCSDNVKEFMR